MSGLMLRALVVCCPIPFPSVNEFFDHGVLWTTRIMHEVEEGGVLFSVCFDLIEVKVHVEMKPST